MRSSPVPRLLGAALAAAVLLLGACSGSPAPPPSQPGATVAPTSDLSRYYSQQVTWTGCSGGFQCTKVAVPLDYNHPDGDSLQLAVIRLPASDGSKRIGALLVNPGGPGASGVDFVRAAKSVFSKSLRASYDIVGFDPRGVGASDPVDCLNDRQLDAFIAVDGSPDDATERQQLEQASQSFADGCEAHSGRLLPFVGTDSAARDMDVIRAVMGDSVLHYFGASYGTFLGATYAQEFPAKVGRMVLDGAVDPAMGPVAMGRGQVEGFQLALNGFIADCLPRSDCPLGPDRATAEQQIVDLLARADAHPLAGDRPVTQSLALLGIVVAMYDPANGWPSLRVALARAEQGDGSVLLQLADLYTDRASDGHYTSNLNEVIYAINCVDRADHSTIAQIRATAAAWAKISPIFGAYLAWSDLPCTQWPVPATGTVGPIHAPGAAPILVVGTTRDPATPYSQAVALASELDSGRLLTYEGDGHTAYTSGNRCVVSSVDRYLVDGALPAKGTVCR